MVSPPNQTTHQSVKAETKMQKLQERLAQKRANNEQGFTLIELLVVIVILGILAAVVVFSVRGITNRGANSACQATKTAMLTAAEANYAQNNTNPDLEALETAGFISRGGGTISGNAFNSTKGWTLTLVPSTTSAPATVTGACPA
jgi:prepilin-type N-terminal cleavage/methylation domain-containing protein